MSPTALEILVSTLPTCRNWLLWFVVWLTGHLTGNFPSVTCLGRSLLARNPELQTATSPPPLDTFYSAVRLLRLRPSDRSVKVCISQKSSSPKSDITSPQLPDLIYHTPEEILRLNKPNESALVWVRCPFNGNSCMIENSIWCPAQADQCWHRQCHSDLLFSKAL